MLEQLKHHLCMHPALLPQDAVKFCYQAAYGGGHLITDPAHAAQYLVKERTALIPNPAIPLTEALGGGLVRLNLASPDAAVLPDSTILRVFTASASHVLAREDNGACFAQALELLTDLTSDGIAPFSPEVLDAYLNAYRAAGCPMVSHTAEYRASYAPAYRVIEESYLRLLPLIARVDTLLQMHPNRCITVAIDGHAASGKTTLAAQLASLFDCTVYHMDDYFLPFDKRTPQRLSEPGGNVDYERFRTEVLDSILAGKAVIHSAFDCSSGTLLPPVTEASKPLAIIEGSYAHHPYFGDAYDLRIALRIDADTQRARILARNGAQMFDMFTSRWIPMEHHYFDTFHIFDNADIII